MVAAAAALAAAPPSVVRPGAQHLQYFFTASVGVETTLIEPLAIFFAAVTAQTDAGALFVRAARGRSASRK